MRPILGSLNKLDTTYMYIYIHVYMRYVCMHNETLTADIDYLSRWMNVTAKGRNVTKLGEEKKRSKDKKPATFKSVP